MVDDILKEIMDDIQSMKPKQMKQYIYDHSKEQLSNKDVSEESQWINAKEKYGELEAIHVYLIYGDVRLMKLNEKLKGGITNGFKLYTRNGRANDRKI